MYEASYAVRRLTVCLNQLALTICHVVDPSALNLLACTKNALPSRDRVGAYNRALRLSALHCRFSKIGFYSLLSFEVKTLVVRRATIFAD